MLNLLPPLKKTTIEQDQLYRFVQRCCWLVLGCSILLSGVMLISRFAANIVLENLHTRSTILVKTPDQTSIDAQLTEINSLTSDVAAIQGQFHNPLPVILQTINTLPDGIDLNNLSINYLESTLHVTGTASDRQQLLTLSQVVSAQSGWTNVKFPLQDFTQKINIPFEFEVTLTPIQ